MTRPRYARSRSRRTQRPLLLVQAEADLPFDKENLLHVNLYFHEVMFAAAGRPGFYLRVVEEGFVETGDAITRTRSGDRAGRNVTAQGFSVPPGAAGGGGGASLHPPPSAR
jgi:hypothetical protein